MTHTLLSPSTRVCSFIEGPLTLERMIAQKKEPSHWQGASSTCLFIQIHVTLELWTWQLELSTTPTTLTWHLDGPHVEWLRQAPGQNLRALGLSRAQALIFWAPTTRLSSILWLVTSASWLSSPPWYLTLSMATLNFAQTIDSLESGQALNNLSLGWKDYQLQVSHSQIWQVQALNLSSSIKGATYCRSLKSTGQ